MEITLEKIELVKDRTGVSYKEAKEALEKADGSVIDAIVAIEEKVDLNSNSQSKSSIDETVKKIKDLVKRGNISKITIKKDDEIILNIPLNVGIIGAVAFPWGMVASAVAAFGLKCKIQLITDEGKTIDISEKAEGVVSTIKEKGAVVVDEVVAKGTEAFNEVKEKAPETWEEVKDKGTEAFSSFKDAASEKYRDIMNKKDDGKDDFDDLFDDEDDDFVVQGDDVEIGVDIDLDADTEEGIMEASEKIKSEFEEVDNAFAQDSESDEEIPKMYCTEDSLLDEEESDDQEPLREATDEEIREGTKKFRLFHRS